MKPYNAFNVSSLQALTHACGILKVEGYFRSATTQTWLQVHDSTSTPAEASVPVKEWPIYGTAEFFKVFIDGELSLSQGCYVCISTTEGTKTLSTDVMDLSVESKNPDRISGTTVASATGVTGYQVWSNAGGPKYLYSANITNLSGTVVYLMLFGDSTIADGAFPIKQWNILANASKNLYFGEAGFLPQQVKSGTGLVNGCEFVLSDTTGVLTTSASTMSITVEYKA